jgi:hypothetical protein
VKTKVELITAAALLISACTTVVPASLAESKHTQKPEHVYHKNGVYEEVLINASPSVVWKSKLEQRQHDPDSAYVKPVTKDGEAKVEQKFVFPSPFGSAECVLHLSDTPAQRVDFKLVESEELKFMEGSWVLTPTEDGHGTKLGLSSYVEANMFIPRLVTNGMVGHRVKRNLAQVKKIAEKASTEKSM